MIVLLSGLLSAQAGVVTSAPPPPADSDAPRRVALLVGIDRYSDPALGNLRYAAKDAIDLAEVLSDPDLGAFDTVQVLSGEVSAAEIRSALDMTTAHLRRDDTFLLFIAGHGTLSLAQGTELFVMPSDATLSQIEATGIAMDDLQDMLSSLPSRRRALILDTCHSGTGRSVISPDNTERIASLRGPLPAPTALAISQSEVRMYSAHFNQPAMEDNELENGVYTHFLIEALAGMGDGNGDGLIDAVEAHAWARDATLRHTGGVQVPWMETQLVGREEIFLAGNPDERTRAERALLIGLAKLPHGASIAIDGQVRGAAGVQPGWHDITVEVDGEVLVEQSVHLSAGEELDLGHLVVARQGLWWIDIGGQVTTPNDWTALAGPQVGLWWTPTDEGGGRVALGVQGTMGVGEVPSGQVFGRAGWWWGNQLVAGPTVDAGVFWRLKFDQNQAAPVIAPGMQIRRSWGAVQVSMHGSALSFIGDEERFIHPRASLSVGWAP